MQRWNEGCHCHNATQLFREIQEQGFEGRQTIVLNLIRQFRKASDLPPKVRQLADELLTVDPSRKPLTLRTVTYWLLRRPEHRKEEDEELIERISSEQPRLGLLISLARDYAAMIRQQKADELDHWLDQAGKSGCQVWKNFAVSLRQDHDAVKAALMSSWSNGPTEGHINQLKCLKRQMYGRAKDDLLHKRVLWQGKQGLHIN